MMAERDITVSLTTILRWAKLYVPEFEQRGARFARPINSSLWVDETSVAVQGRWNYLWRAVDRNRKSVHSQLSGDRTIESAQELFRQAVRVTWPQKINVDGNDGSRHHTDDRDIHLALIGMAHSPGAVGPDSRSTDRVRRGYFVSTIFFRFSRPAWYTPRIVSSAVLSFAPAAGCAPVSLRLNQPSQVAVLSLRPTERTVNVER